MNGLGDARKQFGKAWPSDPIRMKGRAFDDIMFSAIAVAVVCVALITPLAAASRWNESATIHPNHFSTAEVGWNEKTGKFEIALCVWPSDLEKALAELAGKSIDLEKKEGLDELIAQYIASKFTICKVGKDSATGDQTVVPDSKGGSANSNRQSASDADAASASSDSDKPVDVSASKDKQADKSEAKETLAEEQQTDEGSSTESKESDSLNASDSDSDTKKADPDTQKSSNTSAAVTQPTTDAADMQDVPNAPPNSQTDAARDSHGHLNPAVRNGESKLAKDLPEGFRWVGFESNAKDAWLYFELPGDLEPATYEVENRVFFEFNEEQINQIRYTCAGRTRSFSLKRNVPTWQFSTERAKLRKQNPLKSPSDGR